MMDTAYLAFGLGYAAFGALVFGWLVFDFIRVCWDAAFYNKNLKRARAEYKAKMED